MIQSPNQILGKFMIFYGIVFVAYSVSSITITILNTQNYILYLGFYVPLFVPHVFVFETLLQELGIHGNTLTYMWEIIVGVFGAISLVSAFMILKNKQLGINFVFWLMIISVIFSIFALALTDINNPGYEILSIVPLAVSSLILYYMQRKHHMIYHKNNISSI